MADEKHNVITIGAKDGQSLSIVGDTYRVLVAGKDTNGEFATIDMLIPPGGGPGPHSHAGFNETFYVIDGEVEVNSENGSYTATKGSYIVIPKGGIVHNFKNTGTATAHLLCTVIPAGLEEFFQAIGKPVDGGEFLPPPAPAELQKIGELAGQYGQKLYPPDYFG